MSSWGTHRVDANHAEIVDGLRAWGASVKSIASVGKDVPDLLVGYQGLNFIFEVKTEKGELSPGQVKFISQWKGEIFVCRSVADGIAYLQERTDHDGHTGRA